jgi:hypothetical protein
VDAIVRKMKTGLLVAGAAAWALLAASAAQAATVTVGSPLTAGFTGSFAGTATEVNFALGEPGTHVTSPVNGTIVSYRIKVYSLPLGRFAIRAIRPASGGDFTGVGTGPPVTPPGTGLQSFSANLPIRAGDFVGLDLLEEDSVVAFQASGTGSTVYEWGNDGFLADGATAPPANTYTGELAFNADVRYCLVPNVVGKKLKKARAALAAADCTAGRISPKKKKRKGKKFVISQSAAVGSSIAYTEPVNLTLGKRHKR